MSRRLEEQVKRTAPIGDDEVGALWIEAEAELSRAIMAEERPAASASRRASRFALPRLSRSRVLAWSVAGVTAVGAFALVGVSLSGDGALRTGPEQVWAAAALRVADSVPRLLVGEEGWTVTRADEFTVEAGEMAFSNGARSVDLTWRPASTHEDYVKDRTDGTEPLPDTEVLGQTAKVFRYKGSATDVTALWTSGGYSLELRVGYSESGPTLTVEQFNAVLRSLKTVSVDEWLSAMPASVVKPGDRRAVVEEMLGGIPLPDGFDTAKLLDDDNVKDRYQLGAQVSGAVACAWIDRWADARDAGDRAAQRAAADALLTSRTWPVLREMNADGDYPEVVWEYADVVAGRSEAHGSPLEESAAEGLGCDSR